MLDQVAQAAAGERLVGPADAEEQAAGELPRRVGPERRQASQLRTMDLHAAVLPAQRPVERTTCVRVTSSDRRR
jgi:hypothetical protein